MLTPYQFASNRPIDGIDLDGLETFSVHDDMNTNTTLLTLIKVDGPLSFVKNGLVVPLGSRGRDFLASYYNSLGFYVKGNYLMERININSNDYRNDPRISDRDLARGYIEKRVGIYADIPNSEEMITYAPTEGIRVPGQIGNVVYENLETLSPSLIPNPIQPIRAPVLNLRPARPAPPPPLSSNFNYVNPDPASGISVLGSIAPGWTTSDGSERLTLNQVSATVSTFIGQMRASGGAVNTIVIYRGASTRPAGPATAAAAARENTLLTQTMTRLQADNPSIPVVIRNRPATAAAAAAAGVTLLGPPVIQTQ